MYILGARNAIVMVKIFNFCIGTTTTTKGFSPTQRLTNVSVDLRTSYGSMRGVDDRII